MRGTSAQKAVKKQRQLTALRHGLTGQVVVMPQEELGLFQAHCQEYQEQFQPVTKAEKELTQTLAETRWRLNRVAAAEINAAALQGLENAPKVKIDDEAVGYALATAALVRDCAAALTNLSLYEQRLSRQYKDVAHRLWSLQWNRKYKDRERKRRETEEQAA